MSEYQYYEFQAIDRPLTAKETDVLRSYSTRARITPTSFVNEYSWGDFKGDEDAWMDKYFDAFLYLANWGTHVLKLRLPARLLDPAIAKTYCGGEGTSAREKAGKVILSFHSEDEEGGDWVEGEGQLSSLISVRAELARGDLRALYLGWLLRAQGGELEEDDAEPPVPPGLGQLSASLESLVEFLRIDSDLVHVAAEASAPISEVGIDRKQVASWITQLSTGEKNKILTSLVVDADQTAVMELRQRFVKERGEGDGKPEIAGRTVGDLLRAAEELGSKRSRMEAERRAKEKARRDREEAAAKEKHLNSLVGRENKLWGEVDALVATKLPKCYDKAVGILVDLRDLAARGKTGAFTLRIEAFREAHAKKPSFLQRLAKAGL